MKEADFIILGGGLSGVLLGWRLEQAGARIVVMDQVVAQTSSRVAGGVVNPVTGMRLVRSWQADVFYDAALDTFTELESLTGLALVTRCSILEFFHSREQESLFRGKAVQQDTNLSLISEWEQWQNFFDIPYGMGAIDPCLLVELGAVLDYFHQRWMGEGKLVGTRIDWAETEIGDNYVIAGGWKGRKLICCEGAEGDTNPYFQHLPWSWDKGEALVVSIRGLPRGPVYKKEFALLPWRGDLFWVGASHEWRQSDLAPSVAFRQNVTRCLDGWLKLPYSIVDHLVARRPANLERKPFVGMHPAYPSLGILNGMGGKGVGMIPLYSRQLAEFLVTGKAIDPQVDVSRFRRVLSPKAGC